MTADKFGRRNLRDRSFDQLVAPQQTGPYATDDKLEPGTIHSGLTRVALMAQIIGSTDVSDPYYEARWKHFEKVALAFGADGVSDPDNLAVDDMDLMANQVCLPLPLTPPTPMEIQPNA